MNSKRYRELIKKGKCPSHPNIDLVPGHKSCHICIDRNKEYSHKHREDINQYKKNYRRNNPKKNILHNAKTRAKRKGVKFNISEKDIEILKYCPILPNILLKVNKKRLKENSISLDRINNSKGYIKGNVQIISNKANIMKSNATREELLLFRDWINKMEKSKW